MLQFGWCAQSHNPAAKNKRKAIAIFGLLHIVRGYEYGDSLLSHLVNQFPKLATRDWINAGGWLIEKDNRRIVQHRAPQRQALLPSAGEGAGDEIFLSFQVRHLQRPFDARVQFSSVDAVETGKQTYVLNDLEIVIERELLRHIADLLAHLFRFARDIEPSHGRSPRSGSQQPAQHADRGGFSGPVGSKKTEHFASANGEIDAIDGHKRRQTA